MGEEVPEILREGVQRLHIPFRPDQLVELRIFLEELARWNKRYRFVALPERDPGRELIVRHVLDSLSAWKRISDLSRRRRVGDVGSGAGFPGIPLAVFLPDSHFTLVEPSATKAAFLRNVRILAGLKNVEIAEARLQTVEQRFDLVVLRAFSPLSRELGQLRRILHPHGVIIAYKGKRERILEELQAAGLDSKGVEILAVQVPFLEEERHLVVVPTSSAKS
jgi:16S rRNA (guanine527-N7)-methyltransferase